MSSYSLIYYGVPELTAEINREIGGRDAHEPSIQVVLTMVS
jgi:hypothetical protein